MEVIKQYQLKHNLVADGIIGKQTLYHIKVTNGLTNEQTAHYLAQIAHESANFTQTTENLNYSVQGLLSIFPKYFKEKTEAIKYARQPQKIANRVYANRMGNGDEISNEGFLFRGRGGLQTTGKTNYQLLANYLNNQEIMQNPDLVASTYFFESAKFFFDKNQIWKLATEVNVKSITAVTKKVNGGITGLEDRVAKTQAYYHLLTFNEN